MKFTDRALPLLLAAALAGSLAACAAPESTGETPEGLSAAPPPPILRAVTVGTRNAPDYPGAEKLTRAELEQKADAVLAFAAESSMNAVLYKATPYGEAAYLSDVLPRTKTFDFSAGFFEKLDPLEILTERAAERGIAVYALVSPYEAGRSSDKPGRKSLAGKRPEAVISVGAQRFYRPDTPEVQSQAVAAAEELAQKYALTGIVLSDTDGSQVSDYAGFYTYLNALAADMLETLDAVSGGRIDFGVALAAPGAQDANRAAFIGEICRIGADLLIPTLPASAEQERSPHARELSALLEAAGDRTAVVPALPADTAEEAGRQAFFVNNLLGVYGGVLDGYATLSAGGGILDAAIPLMHIERGIVPDITFDVPEEFRITRPLDGELLKVDAAAESYYITGTSDPRDPVLLDGEEVERLGTLGLFGALVELEYGENTFEFMQNGKTLTARIDRPRPDAPAAEINRISTYGSPSSSAFQPFGPQAVNDALPLVLQCVAPAGGKVTALLDGEEYELEQMAKAEEGAAVKFRKEVRIPAPDADAVTSAGFVTYTLDYQGGTSEAEAPGEVFLVGSNRAPMFRVTDSVHWALRKNENGAVVNDGIYAAILKYGSVGRITGQTDSYFITSYGGYVNKSSTAVVTDLAKPDNLISSAEYVPANEKGDEQLILRGTLPPSFVADDARDGGFTIRLMDTYGLPDGGLQADSRFFSSIQATSRNGEVEIKCSPGTERYFGYNVSYSGGDTVISFKRRPSVSGVRGRPLSGMTIVLDPGHGGTDPGAAGIPGATGPTEKDANLYAALMTRPFLEGLGASVFMTRETDSEFPTLDERVAFTEDHDADLFLSLHHNSLAETMDPIRAEGTEVYYWNSISEGLAEKCLEHISRAAGRRARKYEPGYYVFLRNNIAPSVLLELGFMPNPTEYEKILDRDEMLAVARSISEAVVDYLESQP